VEVAEVTRVDREQVVAQAVVVVTLLLQQEALQELLIKAMTVVELLTTPLPMQAVAAVEVAALEQQQGL
jgi:hypothetical protein